MVVFSTLGLLSDGPQNYLTGITDLDIHQYGGDWVLYAASGPSAGVSSYRLAADGAVTLLDRDPFTSGQLQAAPGQLEQVQLGADAVLVSLGRHVSAAQCFDLDATGRLVGVGQFSVEGGFPAAIVSMECVALGSRDLVYTGQWGTTGLAVYEIGANGQLTRIGHVGPSSGAQGADIVAVKAVETGGQTYLLAASAFGDAVISYRLDSTTGMPVQTDSLGAADGLGVDAPSALVTVAMDGVQYAVLAAAGSSSLSVLELAPDGGLEPMDHVIDSLDTRFAAVTALEAVEINGRIFLVAGGGDDGLSLFTLLPGGRLAHLAAIADSTDTALTNITAIALNVRDGGIDVFASGEAEAGIMQLRVDPGVLAAPQLGGDGGDTLTGSADVDLIAGGAGDDHLDGWNGDDILMDGAGSDTLRGGRGDDLFVMAADGETDHIIDFTPGEDRLDLSAIGRLYSLAQLTITATTDGAVIAFGGEELRLTSIDYAPLPASAFSMDDFAGLMHFDVEPVDPPPLSGGAEGGDTGGGDTGGAGLVGGPGDDTLIGGPDADSIRGLGGSDRLIGRSADDTLYGGDSRDWLYGLYGNDVLWGEAGDDSLFGGSGNDVLHGGDGLERLYGQSGDDSLNGGEGRDKVFGGDGDDSLNGGGAADSMAGGAGDDSLWGGSGDDVMRGDDGADWMDGGAGDDWMDGGRGENTLHGGDGNDRLYGRAQNDTQRGGAGNDRLVGRDGDDTLSGEADNDHLYGGGDDDLLEGGDGVDWLEGEAGDDTLYGGAGNDRLYGRHGDDVLSGGSGDDVLRGNAGSDVFVFASGFGSDAIADFDAIDPLERIDLSAVSGITSYADLMANHVSRIGNMVVIEAGGNRLELHRVDLVDLDASDFIF